MRTKQDYNVERTFNPIVIATTAIPVIETEVKVAAPSGFTVFDGNGLPDGIGVAGG